MIGTTYSEGEDGLITASDSVGKIKYQERLVIQHMADE